MLFLLKQVTRMVCPPVVWKGLQWGRRLVANPEPAAPVPQLRMLATIGELDAELEHARPLAATDFDAWAAHLDSIRFELPASIPADPYSREYRDYQMAFYKLVTGGADYRAEVCEQITVEPDKRERPFPYYTRSSTVVGEQLMAIGFMIRASATQPDARVLEFGPGFGRLTLELARMGLDVTAVEINPLYVDLIREHSQREGLQVNLHCCGMLDYAPAQRFDRVFFYECFHHCSDHVALVAKLDSLVAPGGAVVFAGEPITDDFPMPWGLRRDGRSLWAIRLFRWLELGFRTDYFLDMLARHGWVAEVHNCADVPWQRVFVARRASEVARTELLS